MKKFTLLLTALLITSFSALAQIKLVVCQEGGARSEFIASSVDSIIFVGLEDTPEVELPGEGKIRFIVDATAVDACYGVGFVGKFCNWDPNQTFQGTEFAENMFYIDMPSMTAEEFGNARILLLHEDGTSSWDYQVSSNGYDITGSEDYITIIDDDDYGTLNAINLVADNIDNVVIKIAILAVNDTPCKSYVPAGYAKFVLTVTGNVPAGKDVIFTGSFEEKLWGESDRVMTKQADGTYVWEGAYPENFKFKAFIADCEDLGFIDNLGDLHSELWLEGADRLVEPGFGSVIEFEGCFQYLCPEDDDPVAPETGGFVAKPFSVSATKTVTFSPGNLQYHAANDEWRFAPNQTDYIGEANENISSTYNGWIDLFGWGTGNNPTNKSTDYDDYSTFVDWGVNRIGSYSPNTWRTLTYDEWYYLRWERPNYDKLIGIAEVNGVNGLILLPDAWVCPSGVTFKSGFDDDYCTECYGNYQTISALEWSKLEASGAVFFPAAGYRGGSDVYGVQYYGYYWSATEDYSGLADGLYFNSDEAYMDNYLRFIGQSVRLVRYETNQEETPSSYTLSFDANGGSGSMSAVELKENESTKIPTNTFTRHGYRFIGWNTKADGTGTSYTEGQTISLTENTNLYAQWKEKIYDGSFVAKPFSVSATKTVTFSPGNLQYHPANDEWRFAQNQTDYIGGDNENISSTYNGWIDLFCWGTGNNPTNNSTDYHDYPTFVDWGVNKIGNYAPNTWRTLTCSEWYYLRYERPNYNKLIGVAQVNGVNGLIILPDGWTCPSGVTFKSGFHNNYGTQYYVKYQTFSASEWSKLEASGAVFFPAAGGRYGSDVGNVQDYGSYWSATGSGYGANYLYFSSDGADMYDRGRGNGQSVRLVQD